MNDREYKYEVNEKGATVQCQESGLYYIELYFIE